MAETRASAPSSYSDLAGVIEALPLLVREARRARGLSVRAAAVQSLVTDRQRQILALLAQGYSKAEVGQRLFITEDTVKTQLLRTYARIGARNRVHAVALLMAAGEITLPERADGVLLAQ